ncbi:MAG: hypothetical protein O9341_10930, partial [Paucibacter sp.]|nr:hypothetical protein [Roseateles sp.]
FGKSVREIAPFLKDLGEAGQINAKATAEQAEQAEKFNKALAEWDTNAEQARRALVTKLLPAINDLVQDLKDATAAYGSFWDALIDQGLGVDPFKSLNENLTATSQEIAKIKGEMAKTEGMRGGWLMGDAAVDSDLKRLREQLRLLEAREKVLRQQQLRQGGGRGLVTPLGGGDDAKPSVGPLPAAPEKSGDKARAERINEAQRALSHYVAELQKELDKGEELTDQQRALNLLKSLGTTGQVPEVRELVLGMSQQVTLLKQDEAIRRDINAEMERQLALQKSLDDAIEQFSGRTADALKAQQTARLEARIAAGESFSPEELDRIVKGIGGIKDEMKPQLDQMDEMLKQFGRNAQDALGDTILRSLKGDFDSIEKLWGNLLANMVAQALAAKVGKELFGDLFSGGDLGGGVGSLLKLGANFFGMPGFASGGDHGGGWRIVGERGPELEATGAARIFNAAQTAQILGGGGGAGGGRSVSLHYAPTIQIDGRADRAQSMQDAQAVMRQGQKEMLQMLKAKGVV